MLGVQLAKRVFGHEGVGVQQIRKEIPPIWTNLLIICILGELPDTHATNQMNIWSLSLAEEGVEGGCEKKASSDLHPSESNHVPACMLFTREWIPIVFINNKNKI